MEYALPDRVRIFEKNEVTLWIGKNSYRKKGGGLWKKYSKKTSDICMWAKNLEKESDVSVIALPAIALENLIKDLAQTEDIKLIGRETVDAIPTLAYQHAKRSNTRPNTMKTWIGVADGLLRRWEFECEVLGSTASPVVYTYYDYNADIKIEPPTEYVSVDIPETVLVDPRLEPKRDELVMTGLPTGVPGPPSAGPGSDGGMGSGGGMGPGPGTGNNPNAPVTSVDSRPVILNNPQPRYTEKARRNKVEGTVLLRIVIGSDGLVKRVTITRGLPDGLDEQAVRAAYQLRFKPAMKGGQPVAFQTPIEVEFNLRVDK